MLLLLLLLLWRQPLPLPVLLRRRLRRVLPRLLVFLLLWPVLPWLRLVLLLLRRRRLPPRRGSRWRRAGRRPRVTLHVFSHARPKVSPRPASVKVRAHSAPMWRSTCRMHGSLRATTECAALRLTELPGRPPVRICSWTRKHPARRTRCRQSPPSESCVRRSMQVDGASAQAARAPHAHAPGKARGTGRNAL